MVEYMAGQTGAVNGQPRKTEFMGFHTEGHALQSQFLAENELFRTQSPKLVALCLRFIWCHPFAGDERFLEEKPIDSHIGRRSCVASPTTARTI